MKNKEIARRLGRTLSSVESKLGSLRGRDARRRRKAEEQRQERDDEILDQLEMEDTSALTDGQLFSAIMYLLMLKCTHPVLTILRIGFQIRNPKMLKVLGVPELTDKEIEDFVTEYPDLTEWCLNIGYSGKPFFDIVNTKIQSNINDEPLQGFNRGPLVRASNREPFSPSEVRDQLKAECIGVAHFKTKYTARLFERFLHSNLLAYLQYVQPHPDDTHPVKLTSGICTHDNGDYGGPKGDGHVHSVFVCYATKVIGTSECQSKYKGTPKITLESGRNVSVCSPSTETLARARVHIADDAGL